MDESHCRQVIEHYLLAYNRFDIDARCWRTTFASKTIAVAS